jgi:hypothetical protein
MSHCLIFGMTESGKTTLAKRLAQRFKYNEVPVIVLDSLNDPEWQCDFQTTDPEEFLRVFWSSKRCACFIDEAGDAVGRYNTVMQRTATRGRHWGHSVHYISQRGVQIAPTVRDQCGHIFLLTTSVQDGKVHANEWNQPDLLACNSLAKGNYFHCTRFGKLERGSLFGAPHGDNTDTGDGRRNVRKRTDPQPAPQEEENRDNLEQQPAPGPAPSEGVADTSNPAHDTGPALDGAASA